MPLLQGMLLLLQDMLLLLQDMLLLLLLQGMLLPQSIPSKKAIQLAFAYFWECALQELS